MSLLLCTICMFCIFIEQGSVALFIFGLSVFAMIGSLLFSLVEIVQSVHAIDLHLGDFEQEVKKGEGRSE